MKPKMESDSDFGFDLDGIDHKTEGIINSIEKSLTFVPDSLSDPDRNHGDCIWEDNDIQILTIFIVWLPIRHLSLNLLSW